MNRDRILEAIKNISKFSVPDETDKSKKEYPFAIIGPAGNDKDDLRIYAYGGCVGKLKGGERACELLDRDYFKNHCESLSQEEKATAEEWIRKSRSSTKTITGEWCNDVIDTNQYLNMALKAIKNKFKKSNGVEKERNLQMQILSRFLKRNSRWCIVDVETGITEEILPEPEIIKNVKKPDFVVFDKKRKQFGIIEMKAFNENADNLHEHYVVFNGIYLNPVAFVQEMAHRASIMAKYELIEPDDFEANNSVWFGFLFVKGGITGAKKLVRQYMKAKDNGEWDIQEECRFLYVDDVKELDKKGLCFDEMYGIEDFMGK